MKTKQFVPTNLKLERKARKMLQKLAEARGQTLTAAIEQIIRAEYDRMVAERHISSKLANSELS